MNDWPYTITGGPWPERLGLKARIVPQPAGRLRYPWAGKLPSERVILIDDDAHEVQRSNGVPLSCVIDFAHLAATP